jgi:hypothetical protein
MRGKNNYRREIVFVRDVNHQGLFVITYRRNKLESLGQILVELGHKLRHFKHLFREDLHCHVDVLAIIVKVIISLEI